MQKFLGINIRNVIVPAGDHGVMHYHRAAAGLVRK